MYSSITLKRGLDLRLKGEVVEAKPQAAPRPQSVAIVPDDYPGFTPRVAVKEGDAVKAGQAVLTDKVWPDVALVSPIDGVVKAVVRGDRRKIMRVVIAPNAEGSTSAAPLASKPGNADEIKAAMQASGLWAMMRQRPYAIVPVADSTPVNIFVTAIDSAPLAIDMMGRVADDMDAVVEGLKALASLTDGKVYVGVRNAEPLKALADGSDKIVVVEVTGKHPAGNAGVQAAALAPVNKGETIWTLDIVTAKRIGCLVSGKPIEWTTTVALTGSEMKQPKVVTTVVGADVESLIKGETIDTERHLRVISGNVLTGTAVGPEGYLRYPYQQVTVIPEGDDVDEFLGWASLSPNKMSQSRSFISRLFPFKKFAPDARINGGRRAMIMSGVYESVMPMDIMPEHLVKAILSRNIDQMEALGIYEVAPEDFALCEYVDPSKLELQRIVREGLDYLRKELS